MKKVRDLFVMVEEAELLTPTGMFLIAANVIHSDDYVGEPCQVQNAKSFMDGVLAAARKAGVQQTDRLGRLMRTDRLSIVGLGLAQRACDAIPSWKMNDLLMRSHRAAEAGAPLYPAHGMLDCFVGAQNRIVSTLPPTSAPAAQSTEARG